MARAPPTDRSPIPTRLRVPRPPGRANGRPAGTLRLRSRTDVKLVRRAWEAFARGDVSGVLTAVHPQARWHAAGDPDGEGACHDRDDVEAFLRDLLADGVTAELLDVRDAGDRVVALIQRRPPDPEDRPPPHGELITVRAGEITEIVSYPTMEDALAAAGVEDGRA